MREKVAICGSSGSSKSSTVLLLLKLLDPLSSTAQNITIDSRPLHKIDRQTLRQLIVAIPQDPVFLPDRTSFQANLDQTPSVARSSKPSAWHLTCYPRDRNSSSASPAPFCVQRIRARERVAEFGESAAPSGIFLLDEVSSSVDQDRDRAMEAIIRAEFQGYTIVMVRHRLKMVMEFDTMVVMEKGENIKTAPPKELLKWEEGRFQRLC